MPEGAAGPHEPGEIPQALVGRLRAAEHVVVFTGAGVSAESGIPTFRDALTGLWARYRAEDLATPEAFRRDPLTVWRWYVWRRSLLERCEPNPAHHAIAEMERHVPRLTLITQNVDGLHQRAGSTRPVELHGNLGRDRCFAGCGEISSPGWMGQEPQACARCGSLMRPDVVWFGEILPEEALESAIDAGTRCDVLISLGTSGLVEPAASIPRIAARSGATLVVVNPDASEGEGYFALRGRAGAVLPSLVSRAWKGA